jgi:hypothetical protein
MKYTKKQIEKILADHHKWLNDNEKGKRADLKYADLRYADLKYADMSNADLSNADLRYAVLSNADMSNADLSKADLRYAVLSNADLRYAKNIPDTARLRTQIVPETGSYEAWKKCKNGVIVKLLIQSDAKRSNATGRKCRSDFAVVLEVIGADEGISCYDNFVIYKKGETVKCHAWEENRWIECGGGIHHYITRAEAEQN